MVKEKRAYSDLKSTVNDYSVHATRNLNCMCGDPRPEGDWKVGKHEGRYKLCLTCGKRIWN